MRRFLRVETIRYLIQSRSDTNETGLVFLPQEVVWTSIDGLHFPWDLVLVIQVSGFPDPSTQAVFSAKRFVH